MRKREQGKKNLRPKREDELKKENTQKRRKEREREREEEEGKGRRGEEICSHACVCVCVCHDIHCLPESFSHWSKKIR